MQKHPIELTLHDWQALDEGDTLRVACSHWKCEGKNDAFTITRIAGGCIYNCYRCGTSGMVFKGRNPSEALRYVRSLRDKRHACRADFDCELVQLPYDCTPLITHADIIPSQAYGWLYKYEMDDTEFYEYNMCYSAKMERIVIPIYSNDCSLLAWQGRDVYYKRNVQLYEQGRLDKKPLKWYTEYNKKVLNDAHLFFKLTNDSSTIFIVEDVISAIKVFKKFNTNVVALLNSTLHDRLINELNLFSYKQVLIWLDPDARIKALQGALRWKRKGVSCKTLDSSVDPKEVYYNDMEKVLDRCNIKIT